MIHAKHKELRMEGDEWRTEPVVKVPVFEDFI